MKDMSAKTVIDICKRNFARHGVPEIVITDGGTNFVCQEFEDFAHKWGFSHNTSSPHHPQGNGKAEATVKIAKKLLTKTTENKEDFWYGLLCLRNTPNKLKTSPVQRLFSRRTRGNIPMIPELLHPKIVPNVARDITLNRERTKSTYDKRSKKAVSLRVGQPVAVQINPSMKEWSFGVVEDIISDRNFLVNVNNVRYRRNLCHIRPAPENIALDHEDEAMIVNEGLAKHNFVNENERNSADNSISLDDSLNNIQAKADKQLTDNALTSLSSRFHTVPPLDTPRISSPPIQALPDDPSTPKIVHTARPKRTVCKPKYLNDYDCT
ncbi:uncharacterized protein K02A2.6-like isoform X2 [Pectinophora gossypiella]|uniref:uncharacterized protein K02A2.6-like isoform X2 n=1 Tax=Pectinophora gossypiella TaxID=13191 RepID=UPI00214E6F59|nr:uncharacterized protein K02A2.6-like isoform X2 [Pectinophora gossypiella]